MPVPKQRKTKSRRNQRRSHHALKKRIFSICQKCKSPVLAHTLCMNCGSYNNREVINVLAKLDKKERKKKEKEMAVQEKEQTGESKELSVEELSKK
ncbi:MAG: 50S ribosomal protein L32 [Candidatus Portnoybacteria bacterium RIFCSPLOWO2_01_FULL_43_11]|uniref:Large ribosomal subunit protein bL32 n=4 Tax=Candidatus Portnoyibacteriota TaxID=1817913 RepID=A0A1G2FDG0_9BACT|nr:MAG: 50S ribosomal protein L32 [Candidatus Portnoybacteria bacterium RIFCSPHIGHO2_01_FULL_40_12b]OGZ39176.1 MAG: 50S ribosomal protein L32 [Candidatus Portnoybacteria bacterium RIFCSPLOWO2_01_FULL_43_11]OGZ39190.1 MAG: 50S ribosomal protein L32 [Candidatus Portnoybacteria bacterium RIFCSPHIGHO2_12_FULL_40_11]OGZ39906.1 MAG: 50S ribosomal protein L32 [Candidatus Portnoybacteria bacterium RIFCSPLOWO2_02_FULL_40_15]